MNFQLGKINLLKPLNEDQIARCQLRQGLIERQFIGLLQFGYERPAPGRRYQDLASAGSTVLVRILAGHIDIERMVSVLEGTDAPSRLGQMRDQLAGQLGFTRPGPTRQSQQRLVSHARAARTSACAKAA